MGRIKQLGMALELPGSLSGVPASEGSAGNFEAVIGVPAFASSSSSSSSGRT
jgi:hypothetical protein